MINFESLLTHGMIDAPDLNLFQFAETAEEIWARLLVKGVKPGRRVAG